MGKTGRYDGRWKPDNLKQISIEIFSWFMLIVYLNLVRVNAIALTQFIFSLSFTTLSILQLFLKTILFLNLELKLLIFYFNYT